MDYSSVESCVICGKKQNALSLTQDVQLFVNTAPECGHKFCSYCIEREFYRKHQFECPVCKSIVLRHKLSIKSIEEVEAERDTAVRRKLGPIFNKTENDFANQHLYNDYQEMVEDIIFNLVHEKDIKQTEQKIEEYKEQNLRSITVNQVKLQQRLADETTTIHEEELFREQREREFQSKMAQELQQKRELRKQQNLALLGEQELTINSSGTFVSKMAADGSIGKKDSNANLATLVETQQPGINPVFAFLNQRPEPKPKTSSNATPRNKSVNTNEMKRKIDAAGGFDYSHYDRRNWTEIKSQLRACSHMKQS